MAASGDAKLAGRWRRMVSMRGSDGSAVPSTTSITTRPSSEPMACAGRNTTLQALDANHSPGHAPCTRSITTRPASERIACAGQRTCPQVACLPSQSTLQGAIYQTGGLMDGRNALDCYPQRNSCAVMHSLHSAHIRSEWALLSVTGLPCQGGSTPLRWTWI